MVLTAGIIFILSLSTHKATSAPVTNMMNNCLITFDSIDTTFDLCSTRMNLTDLPHTDYQVMDSRNLNYEDTTANYHYYKYYFNIFNPLSLSFIHPICLNTTQPHDSVVGYCPDETNCANDTQLIPISDPAWAYQVWFNSSTDIAFTCYHLTNEFGGPPTWSLYHDGDPSLGIQLTFMNGDHFGCNGNRKFRIRLLCSDQPFSVPPISPLHEYAQCEYTLELSSIHGCPIQCQRHANKLCAGNGICGFDWTDNAPRCFCYHQWSGTDCSVHDPGAILRNNSFKAHPNPTSPFVRNGKKDFDTDIAVDYDLSEFAVDNEVYVIHGLDFANNYTYYYGIPGSIYPPSMGGTVLPSSCDNIVQWCRDIDAVSGECLSGATLGANRAFVFQVNRDTNECVCLGKRETFTFYDEDNPAAGLSIVYTRGSWCEAGAKNMEFRIHLVCPKDQNSVYHPRNETKIELYEYIEQDDDTGCSYSFTYFTAIACPYQCVVESLTDNVETFTVCQRNGICAADPNAGFVRCLCDNGWTGVNCQEIATPNPTQNPTKFPTQNPTVNPTQNPTVNPTQNPTVNPTVNPTQTPTINPTQNPTQTPSMNPTQYPTQNPTQNPTWNPSVSPSLDPIVSPIITLPRNTYNLETTSLQIMNKYSRTVSRNNTALIAIIIVLGTIVFVILFAYWLYRLNATPKHHLHRIPSTETPTEDTIATDAAQQTLVDHDSDHEDVETGRTMNGEEDLMMGTER